MASNFIQPASLYAPEPPVDLSSREVRAELSPPGIRAFFKIMERWKVRDEDARALLGGMSNGAYYALKKNPNRVLDQDRLTRISFLLGIYEALNIVHSEPLADAWPTLPNSNPIFRGSTPLAFMVRGGIPAFDLVRRLLEARAVEA